MSVSILDVRLPNRGPSWKWWVCGLLLLATMINYMDRLTLNQSAKRIKDELGLNNEQYGQIESGFGVAFAVGALGMGLAVDRWNVRWVFPAALLGWSAAGFLTGFSQTFFHLLTCRVILGLFEAGNWPCALRTTQHILPPNQRTLGNGILQSGAAIGAIITPRIVAALGTEPSAWPRPFFVIGSVGMVWIVLWLASVGKHDLAIPRGLADSRIGSNEPALTRLFRVILTRRFAVLVVLVVSINLTWHFFRVWLPLFLQEHHNYDEDTVQWFSSAYYIATDAGSLTVGFVALWLVRLGLSVHRSRVLVFFACSLLTLLSVGIAFVERGPLLFAMLLVLGFGALGLFPVYYSLSQELTVRDQGKVTGTLGFTTWMASAAMQWIVGRWLDQTKNWPAALAFAGMPPLIAFFTLLLLWGRITPAPSYASPPEEPRMPADESIRAAADS
jgi:ACS family hexuronate transporter-like MFS transporter